MDDTKLIIVDNYQEYIDEMKDCARQEGLNNVVVCDNEQDLAREIQKTPMEILLLISVSDTVQRFSNIV